MPDPGRPLRRLTHARPISRAATHVVVIGLVAFAAAFGISAARSDAPDAVASREGFLPFELVARARGAAGEAQADRSTAFRLRPDGGHLDPMLSRGSLRTPSLPEPTPLPTPVAPPAPAPDPPTLAAAPLAPPQIVTGTGVLTWPVPGGTISQYYSSWHLALDVAAPYGSAVVAADAGVVTWAGWRTNGGGLVVAIDHGNGISTVYNHLGSIWVGPGQAVAKGEGIAGVGCTGVCTGPHVHFETIVGGVLVNPLRYL